MIGDKVKKIGDYVAGDPFNARTYPPGYALKLPAGHDIFFEMHYTPTGLEEEPDVSRRAVKWADAPRYRRQREAATRVLDEMRTAVAAARRV